MEREIRVRTHERIMAPSDLVVDSVQGKEDEFEVSCSCSGGRPDSCCSQRPRSADLIYLYRAGQSQQMGFSPLQFVIRVKKGKSFRI